MFLEQQIRILSEGQSITEEVVQYYFTFFYLLAIFRALTSILFAHDYACAIKEQNCFRESRCHLPFFTFDHDF